MLVQSHDIVLLYFVEFNCSNTKSGEPVLLCIFFFACLQVMPSSSPAVMMEQLRVMFESGSTPIGSVRRQLDGKQEDCNRHFASVADEESVQ